MKLKPLALAVVVLAGLARLAAQDFQGTITWKMSAELTDPAMRAQMDSASQQMADPATQAKLAQAQAAMQNPQMQAMMAQNPQMKAMIEKQLAALNGAGAGGGAGGNMMSGLFPKGFTVEVKDGNSLTKIDGGARPMETLTVAPAGTTYLLDTTAKTYRKLSLPAASGDPAKKPRVTPTMETAKIMNYSCTKYLVEIPGGRENMLATVWATKDIPGMSAKQLSHVQMGGRDSGSNFMAEIDGLPVKMEMTTPQAKITMELVSVTPVRLDDSRFRLPPDYTEQSAPDGK